MFLTAQRYKFESKSQQGKKRPRVSIRCFSLHKDTNLKANHNTIFRHLGRLRMFLTAQRYKFESKSQHQWHTVRTNHRCFSLHKDTNLKANHNVNGRAVRKGQMFLTAQRYKFESKSQHIAEPTVPAIRCFSLHKDTNLKANHNKICHNYITLIDVSHCTKIQI